ncbi:MAG: discoidin domain-containing protein [Phycisphaerales bacterium]|nr:MAG: discoidin domain-containing protein [Phycisphaerales bacterium]
MCRFAYLICLGLVLTLAGVDTVFGATVIERRVSAGSDDAEEAVNPGFQNTYNTSSDLEIVDDNDDNGGRQFVGMNFRDITVPPWATIHSAYIEFACDATKFNSADAYLLIWGHLALNPDGFGAPLTPTTISDRPRTKAKVQWEPEPWTAAGQISHTSDISSIIEEIVNQDGWASGNAIEIIIGEDTSKGAFTGLRAAESFNGSASQAPLLHIEWSLGNAARPNPPDGQTDVSRDTDLSWKAGVFTAAANGHTLYFDESFNNVNDGTGGITQSAASYDPGRLEYGTTYYWRVDETAAPPDSTVYRGDVWSFTTEPVGYPIDGANITATASSVGQDTFGPENTIDGSGLDDNDLHSTLAEDMWLSGNELAGAWIQYEFDKLYKLHEMWVWNANQSFEGLFGFGFKDVTVEYSTNGVDWTALAGVPEFAKGPGMGDYAHNTTVDFGSVAAKSVKLSAASNWGGILPQYGLSEVRFFAVPVSARKPSPDSGATDVAVDGPLSWRPGREAATHNVYVSTDQQAVIDGSAPVVSVAEASYSSALDLASTYYWRVDEVNEAETTTMWQGDVWDFATQESIVVEDFEDYSDYPPYEIYTTWEDGYINPANGSQVGNLSPPLAETTIVHGGKQSMPLFYTNTGGATYSEGARTFAVSQNWTQHEVKTLGLFFFGTAGSTGQMYVKINGTKIPYDGEAANISRAGWQPWNIDLTASGLNLQSVSSLAIGVDGNGASGTLYFDDIRLYPYERQFVTPSAPNTAGLIGHWTFDGNTQDSSGKGNHGTSGVTPAAYVAGTVGSNAMDFRGADYVAIDGVVNDITGTDLTISVWIKTTQSGEGELVATNDGASAHPFMLGIQAGNPYVNDGGDTQFAPAVNDDQWHLLTYVRSGNTGYVYVDGFPRGSYSSSFSLSTVTRWSIGQEWDDTTASNFYTGAVDDVRIYNYALSHGEVAWLTGRTEPFEQPF